MKFPKKRLFIWLWSIIVFPMYPQEKFEPSIDISIPIVSTYVFRGVDVFQNNAVMQKKSISSLNFAPAIQPSITFNFTEGWYFNIWSSFALVNRQDKDIDELLQERPGDSTGPVSLAYAGFIAGNLFGPPVPFSSVEAAIAGQIAKNGVESYIKGSNLGPAFYKESVGLKRVDEVDLTLGYGFETKLGTMSGGIVTYLLPNTTKDVVGVDQFTELFVGYSPKAIPDLSITLYGEFNGDGFGGATFTYISYGISLYESDSMEISLTPGIAYQTQNNLQGIKYISLPLDISMGSLSFSIVGIYRPDVRFYDSDTFTGDAVELLGESTVKDGLIPDPSRNLGLINSIVNSYIGSIISSAYAAAGLPFSYTYTPRQSLPKLIYYFSVGYSTSF